MLSKKEMNILITGGAGYIGSILTKQLLNHGFKVTVLDNLLFRQESLLGNYDYSYFEFVYGDVRDKTLLKDLVSKNDLIIPLAAIVGAPACKSNPTEAVDTNFCQIQTIVSSLSKQQRVIIPNTNSQYGSSDTLITEDSPFKPLSLYSQTKCDAEKFVLESGNGVAFRLATVFGVSPRMRLDLLVNDFVYRSMRDGFLVLFESHFKRNYIHVRDVVNAFIFAIHNYHLMNNQAYNVGLSEANLSKLELANKIKEFVPNLVIKEDSFSSDPDKRDYVVSNAKLEALGWKTYYPLEKGIKELISAYPIFKKKIDSNFSNL